MKKSRIAGGYIITNMMMEMCMCRCMCMAVDAPVSDMFSIADVNHCIA